MFKKDYKYKNVEAFMRTLPLALTVMAQQLEKGGNVQGAAVYTTEYLVLTGMAPAFVEIRGVVYASRQIIVNYLIIDMDVYRSQRKRLINPLTSYIHALKKGVVGRDPAQDLDYCIVGERVFPNVKSLCAEYGIPEKEYISLRNEGISGETALEYFIHL